MTQPPLPPPLPGEPPPPLIPAVPAVIAPFRSAGPLGTLTIALLVVNIVVAIAFAASTLAEIRLLQRAQAGQGVTLQEAQRNDDRESALGAAETIAFVVTGIAWLVWVHRAHANLDALGARELKFTHGWAVGWTLFPFANLVMVPQVMSEVTRASDPSGGTVDWKSRRAPSIIAAWWATYLIGIVVRQVGVVQRGATPKSDVITTLVSADRILVASQVVIAIAGLLAIALVRRVIAGQQARSAALGPV